MQDLGVLRFLLICDPLGQICDFEGHLYDPCDQLVGPLSRICDPADRMCDQVVPMLPYSSWSYKHWSIPQKTNLRWPGPAYYQYQPPDAAPKLPKPGQFQPEPEPGQFQPEPEPGQFQPEPNPGISWQNYGQREKCSVQTWTELYGKKICHADIERE